MQYQKCHWTPNYESQATQPGHHLHGHLHRNRRICLNQYSGYTQALDSSCLKNASGVFNNDNRHQNAIVSLDKTKHDVYQRSVFGFASWFRWYGSIKCKEFIVQQNEILEN